MNAVIRNVLAVVLGIVVGSLVNMALVTISPMVIPPPEGIDVSTSEGLKAGMHLFEPKHFVFPFLAHALSTFVGALVAAWIAASKKFTFAMVIAVFFFLGGLASIIMLPSPIWFTFVDLVFAYFPMAYFAKNIVSRD
ncbi:hypothetical protein [Sphingobacterium cellulitidis]|uniref:Uncharacterized protein n=1 Tax=Sphingobacterium cellulitidis TaxID=1768011 RepID=A0A8H9KWR5_9SPHI|nr:hypothetical protein [Sphingobacterium soli]MBA8985934.1 hypothetical protein [Sphingobacterium soli]GGE28426.1 hypothetical protein GCM10011516_27640 [Sphingobacterium soli]